MKALVLAGGTGSRLRPFSYSMPKQLIPIANKPVLEHVLDNIRDIGVTEIGIIVGNHATEIADALGDGSRLGVAITYIPQERPAGLAQTVQLARGFLGDDDFVMYLGDNMLPEGIQEAAAEFRALQPAAQVLVAQVEDPRAFGVAEVDTHGVVERLVEKPPVPRSNLALIGVYFFTPAIHEAVDSIEPSARGELEITDAIQWLVTAGRTVRAQEYAGYWKDTGKVEDVLECNRMLLDAVARSVEGEVDEDSVLIGPVVVEPGARIVNSFVVGPVVIGAGTVLEDSHVGPYTSIGRDCVLTDAHLDRSIALDGSTVSGVRGLRGSLLGRSAAVTGAQLEERHHRLVVGDHTRVEVAA
ncbi:MULTISPECIES: glucose-1-phosphate thymidylyltransferase [unclassified Streptomyces]|jgi:glucose-1-phosphate thymidylyltransferase|uniref:glucose-1-phosphate thymidylyltransferase n=1 Tax=unclassified Streptomyces TaxID=2593676 RepID=UPI000D3D924E|nr:MULTISPECIES: glucose-1-phosphate thymidylyltransferase [unclassified Streptomyces]PTM99069.1 glucose-1-phosphate thymidylyltransferase [Streptomyces sp. VMFN-G11Ma]